MLSYIDFPTLDIERKPAQLDNQETMSQSHTKTTTKYVHPAKTQISLNTLPVRLLFALRKKKRFLTQRAICSIGAQAKYHSDGISLAGQ